MKMKSPTLNCERGHLYWRTYREGTTTTQDPVPLSFCLCGRRSCMLSLHGITSLTFSWGTNLALDFAIVVSTSEGNSSTISSNSSGTKKSAPGMEPSSPNNPVSTTFLLVISLEKLASSSAKEVCNSLECIVEKFLQLCNLLD